MTLRKLPNSQKFRLVTRSDLNGLACLALMKMLDLIDDVAFTHHREIESGHFSLSSQDITANLPYNDNVHLAFNYYTPGVIQRKQIIDYSAASTARVIYNHYNQYGGQKNLLGFPEDLLRAVDKATLAQYPIEDVLNPQDWDLISFLLDHRTGLEKYTKFNVTNVTLIRQIADEISTLSIQDMLNWSNVMERVAAYREQEPLYRDQIKEHFEINNNLVTVDLRDEATVYAGNRFIIYAMFPHVSLSMFIVKGESDRTYEISVGKSIFSRSSNLHIGRLMERYGGGGHANAGTCFFKTGDVEKGIQELTTKIKSWEWLT